MELRNKKALVTGASGFIGSHLIQALLAKGVEVRAMVHYRSSPDLHNLEFLTANELSQVEIVRGEIQDPFFVRSAVKGCAVTFHLAALIGIPYSYTAPAAYVSTNINGTLNILEACRAEGVEKLIHTSTSECYGAAEYIPIDEKHPLKGQSPYAATKIGADKLAESYYRSFDLPVTTVRPFNTFGPRQSARAVIPSIIGQLASGSDEVRLGSLDPVRDLTYVVDTTAGFIQVAETDEVEGETVNLGFGSGVAIGDLAKIIMKLMDREVPIVADKARLRPEKSEVTALISDNSRAADRIGWCPTVSLEDGLRKTITFIQENLHLFNASAYGV